MGEPLEVSHQVARNKSVHYTLVKSRGKVDNIVVEVGGMLQIPKKLRVPTNSAIILRQRPKELQSLYRCWESHLDPIQGIEG